MPKAIIFDLDDTLVESTVDYAKFKVLVIEQMASWGEDRASYSPDETIVAIVSRYEKRMLDQHVEEKEISRRLAVLDKIMDAVEMEHVSDTKAVRGAVDLLRFLRSKGVRIGILTRGCHEYATEALARTGMLELVDVVECRNSRTKPKPNPESYMKLVDSLDVRKEDTMFVGDHPIDAQCAANAGVPFMAVRTGDVPEETLRAAGSVEVFSDVGDMIPWFEERLRN